MGLDVYILTPQTKETVLYMKNHPWFLAQIPGEFSSKIDENYDDFWITEIAVAVLKARFEKAIANVDDIEADDDEDWETVLPIYRQWAAQLEQDVKQHGKLICAWSC